MAELKMYTLKEVSERLHVSRGTLAAWIRNGNLKGVKFGRRWKVSQASLEEFMAQGAPSLSREQLKALQVSNIDKAGEDYGK